jgi:hypothetical protein
LNKNENFDNELFNEDIEYNEDEIIDIENNEEIEWIFPKNWDKPKSPRLNKDQSISNYLTNPTQKNNSSVKKKLLDVRNSKARSFRNEDIDLINLKQLNENINENIKFENKEKRNSFKLNKNDNHENSDNQNKSIYKLKLIDKKKKLEEDIKNNEILLEEKNKKSNILNSLNQLKLKIKINLNEKKPNDDNIIKKNNLFHNDIIKKNNDNIINKKNINFDKKLILDNKIIENELLKDDQNINSDNINKNNINNKNSNEKRRNINDILFSGKLKTHKNDNEDFIENSF